MKRSLQGMTLVEVMVAMAVAAAITAATMRALLTARRVTVLSAQRMAAQGIGKDVYERLRAQPFAAITSESELAQVHQVGLFRLAADTGSPLEADVRVRIWEYDTRPPRKRIRVNVIWNYCGTRYVERIFGMVYLKE